MTKPKYENYPLDLSGEIQAIDEVKLAQIIKDARFTLYVESFDGLEVRKTRFGPALYVDGKHARQEWIPYLDSILARTKAGEKTKSVKILRDTGRLAGVETLYTLRDKGIIADSDTTATPSWHVTQKGLVIMEAIKDYNL